MLKKITSIFFNQKSKLNQPNSKSLIPDNKIILNNSFNKNNPQVVLNQGDTIGIIAGSRELPISFAKTASELGLSVCAVCFEGETSKQIENFTKQVCWIKLGQLGKIINFFKKHGVANAVFIGGISRVKSFKDVSLDMRGALFMAKLRSTKDDVILRGLADELANEDIEVLDSTVFAKEHLVPSGVLTKTKPSKEQLRDIEVGREAIRALSEQHIGQLVVIKDGVVTAVEAVEGSDEAIRRGGKLGHSGTVVVKCAKVNQDMRFDVPVIGINTIRAMLEVSASVLALEAGRCLVMDKDKLLALANENGLVIIGCEPLV
ncbi:MAG: UDP-2,3-diacylglucosamine diphosphatase LpxI [Deltaproteobacteria bacterium]|nr:UDP-2,3-diacylglucosamine diphosphatase LpxI [Deltaproteobacteria bacterium]